MYPSISPRKIEKEITLKCYATDNFAKISKAFVLNVALELEEGASKEDVLKAMEGKIITQAELIGRYARN